jgi:DNA-binding CsgD family transcriptional regulator
MFEDRFASVASARTVGALTKEILAFARHSEFQTVDALVATELGDDKWHFESVGHCPPSYVATHSDPAQGRLDPVMQHCKTKCVPVVWNQTFYAEAGRYDKWEEQAAHGYCTGIAFALHLPRGRHFMIGIDRDSALPKQASEITRLVGELSLFATQAVDAAIAILAPTPEMLFPALTPRELEALRWTMVGKTAWELGNILSISEQTAARHLNNATRKLDCVSKHQAVVKALRLHLIS